MDGVKSTAKLDFMLRIQDEMQHKWQKERLFEVNADINSDYDKRKKFFVTFPYPYMNGRIHLGHAFTLSKCEFTASYHRLKGENVLFPMAFHCTGMPIKASSKSKFLAKQGSSKSQWKIMQSIGIDNDEIGSFANPEYWLRYFPKVCRSDMDLMGLKIDWRRSFITTNINPYYDSFVRWQMNKLKAAGHIKFGKRYTIFSRIDNQACMDHDRSVGEGVGIQEYTLIKLKLLHENINSALSSYSSDKIFLVAATLRPETMYGQTNCWLHPNITYCAALSVDGDVLIATERSLHNLYYQNMLQSTDFLCKITGTSLIGLMVEAPLSKYKTVYCLPMSTIKEDKGTGIVTCVPSDSPDDFVNLQWLKQQSADYLKKFNITEDMINPYQPLPIISVPGFNNMCAVDICNSMDITDPTDSVKLAEAKDKAYSKGFYEGTMLVPEEFRNINVQSARKQIRDLLINQKQAISYFEPESLVVSRSGDHCVVALCDQWYLDYGNEKWKREVRKLLGKLETYSEEARHNLLKTIDWLDEHACSRSYGLGSRLPWAPEYLVESLTDSTVYMAYYTIAHFLQESQPSYDGSQPGSMNINADLLTDGIWDYILCITDDPPDDCRISLDILQQLRLEFKYWYPVDLRCTGKDLLQNHLSYYLYCHQAIWPSIRSLWPKAIRANGLLQLNSAKMSKSTGNFLTVYDSIRRYSADGMRLALADSGDSIEDANFVETVADSFLLRLHTFLCWCIEIKERCLSSGLRSGPLNTFADKVFVNRINTCILKCTEHMDMLQYKDAVKYGFFEMQIAKDQYREMCDYPKSKGEHANLLLSFIEQQVIMLASFCPHICDYIWITVLNKPTSIWSPQQKPLWFDVSLIAKPDQTLCSASDYIERCVKEFRKRLKQDVNCAIITATRNKAPWQVAVERCLKDLPHSSDDLRYLTKILSENICKQPEIAGKSLKKLMPFAVQMLIDSKDSASNVADRNFDELQILNDNKEYLKAKLGNLEFIEIRMLDSTIGESASFSSLRPYHPVIEFKFKSSVVFRVINCEFDSGCVSQNVKIFEGDRPIDILQRISELTKRKISSIAVKVDEPRKIYTIDGWAKCHDNDTVTFTDKQWCLGNSKINNDCLAYFVKTVC
ncbi:hypothetical protein GJ496_005320 [Pomphorhynchus laevis]|nr:hypothetical protein GJ496_005320 [Pomphorhynchus laevis]